MSNSLKWIVCLANLWRNPRTFASFALGLLTLVAQSVSAQPLTLYKTYSVTGDYVIGGVGLEGLGSGTGCGADGTVACASGNIRIPDTTSYPGVPPAVNPYGPKAATFVPDGADIV